MDGGPRQNVTRRVHVTFPAPRWVEYVGAWLPEPLVPRFVAYARPAIVNGTASRSPSIPPVPGTGPGYRR
jgi:hypothetical protein